MTSALPAALFLLALQDPLEDGERERIRSKPPLSEEEKRVYRVPASGEPPKPRASYALGVIPLSFPDAPFGRTDLQTALHGRLADYTRTASGGAFRLGGQVHAPVALPVRRAEFREKDLEAAVNSLREREGEGALLPFDGVAFVAAGGLGGRGTALWPHKGTLSRGEGSLEYILLTESADGRELGVAAHEFMHLLGLGDKYDDPKAQVGRWCIMGTGYRLPDPAPPCADCRGRLGWTVAVPLDPRRESRVVMEPDPRKALKILVNADASEILLLEMRSRLLVWHIGGGARIELLGEFPSEVSDRLTPFSTPPFRGRSAGARPVWITDIRLQEGKAWFTVGPSAPLTPLEERRRAQVGRRLGD